jgi:hypothetical protein
MEITKREVLFSIVIICVMLIIGIIISGNINDAVMEKQQEYITALQINNDKDLFEYGMRTNVGNAFVYGELKAVDTVTFDEIGGQYSYVKKVKERYTQHTRTVTETYTVNGKTQTRTRIETYWTWDRVQSWDNHSEKIIFLESEFSYGTVDFPSASYITTIKESSNIRYKYYGAPAACEVTVYADLRNDTMKVQRTFYSTSIEDAHKSMTGKGELVIFWVIWIVLTAGAVYGFVYLDNYWLEDRRR